MVEEKKGSQELIVEVEPDPLQPTQAELLAARTKMAAVQTKAQQQASLRVAKDWVEQAQELGIPLYERQPEETDIEWLIWTTYRRHYPGRMPSWSALAKECNCSPNTVLKASRQWNFRLRIVEWSRYTDAGCAEERIAAIKEMNRQQLEQAKTLRAKVTEALDYLDPATLKPNEIATLMKLANEQERMIVEAEQLKVEGQVLSSADASAESKRTDASAVSEILSIMANAGALGSKILGIEKKTVTERMVVASKGEEEN